MYRKIAITILALIILMSCEKENSQFNGLDLIGKWNVNYTLEYNNTANGINLMDNDTDCEFEILENGYIYRNCKVFKDTINWYYREQPPKVVFLDEEGFQANPLSLDVIKYSEDQYSLEKNSFAEIEHLGETHTITRNTSFLLNRK